MLPEARAATRDGRSALGAFYRLLATELAAIKAKRAENGTTSADQTGAAAEAREVTGDARADRVSPL